MRPIEIENGYMVCVDCRGYIEANLNPACECLPENILADQETTLLN